MWVMKETNSRVGVWSEMLKNEIDGGKDCHSGKASPNNQSRLMKMLIFSSVAWRIHSCPVEITIKSINLLLNLKNPHKTKHLTKRKSSYGNQINQSPPTKITSTKPWLDYPPLSLASHWDCHVVMLLGYHVDTC